MTTPELEARLESKAFGKSNVHLRALRGREAISRLFEFTLDVLTPAEEPLDLDKVAAAEVIVSFEREGAVLRRIHGVVAEIEDHLVTEAEFRSYRMRLVPRMHRMTLVETQEVSVDTTVPDVIQGKLELVGLGPSLSKRLEADYPKRDFIVQIQETDLALTSRLAEHLGISFFFDQQGEEEKIVFTDHAAGFGKCDAAPELPFRERGEARQVHEFSLTRKVVPSVYAVRDYNYRNPAVSLVGVHEVKADAGGVDEFGVHAKTPEESAYLARVRAEERDAERLVFSGKSDMPAVSAGFRYDLVDHPTLPSTKLLVTEVEHEFEQLVRPTAGGRAPKYVNRFRAMDAAQTFRPARLTPRPRIPGVVTGITETPPNAGRKYAHIDEQGRYLVRLLLDTTGGGDRSPSHPIRMAQPHAGADSGMHFPLRPGTEVIVVFVNGDPDRPIIAGALHNNAMPSVVLDAEQTTNRIKTASGVMIDIIDGR